MKASIRFAGAAALMLAACTSPRPGPSGTADLGDLPLSADVRSELATALARLGGPEARSACTPGEIDFMRISLTLYSVAATGPDESRWSGAQRSRIAELQREFDALGGDARSVSLQCQAMASSLAG